MNKKEAVLVMDMDGTLLGENDRIHPEDIAILKNKDHLPVQFMIATGRSLSGARRALELNLLVRPDRPSSFPMALHNGGLQYLPGEVLFQSVTFPHDVRVSLACIAAVHAEATFLFQGNEKALRIGNTEDGDRGIADYGFEVVHATPQEVARFEFSKVLCLSRQRSIVEPIKLEFEQFRPNGNYGLGDGYEITPQGVDKAFGIRQLLKKMGLTGLPVIVAGDGQNDVSMFKMADYAFTPLNGHESIRALADVVFDKRPHGLLRPMLEKVFERNRVFQNMTLERFSTGKLV